MDTLTQSSTNRQTQPRLRGSRRRKNETASLDPIINKKAAESETESELKYDEKNDEPQTWGQMWKAWPKQTFCIIGDELCEKFSFFGMRAILTLYFLNVLKFNDKFSIIFFNGFSLICSITPLVGSFVADGLIGKYKTIFIGSCFLVIAQLTLAFSSFHDATSPFHPWLDFAGLLIIAFSNGGTKPCVVSFGGDQFETNHTKMISLFFSVFYFFVNISSMVSTFIAPLFRSMPCMGHDSCYPMVFGINAFLMAIATTTFMLGSLSYKKRAPKENIFFEVATVFKGAICNGGNGPKRSHWLENYLNSHDCDNDKKCLELKKRSSNNDVCGKANLIKDIRGLISVLVMYLPIPMYWALYNQQGSVWLIQGIEMDCRLWGDVLLLPDQIRLLNPLLCLIFIPIFQIIIYPLVSKVFKLTHLRKMIAGGIFASLAFACSGLVQIEIEKTLSGMPPDNYAYVSVMNNLKPNCSIYGIGDYPFKSLEYNKALINDKKTNTFEMLKVPIGNDIIFNFTHSCSGNDYVKSFIAPEIKNGKIYNLIITELGAVMLQVNPDKPRKGTGEFSLSLTLALNDTNYVGHLALCRVNPKAEYPCNPRQTEDFYFYEVNYNDGIDTDLNSVVPYSTNEGDDSKHMVSDYTYKAIRPGNWSVWYMHNLAKSVGMQSLSAEEVNVTSTGQFINIIEQGGVYAAVFTGSYDSPIYHVNQIVPSNTVSILWQIPQFVIISLAEILFAISGNEFAYSQAPPSMKALVYALWILTAAFGDSIIVLIAVLNLFENQATQFFVYAGAMLVVIIIFALLSIFYYEYRTYSAAENFDDNLTNDEKQNLKEEEKEMAAEISK